MGKEILVRNIVLGKGMPAIAVPLVKGDEEGLLQEAREAREAGADLAEWRVDSFTDKRPEVILRILSELAEVLEPLPLIFTLRTKREGGSTYEGTWAEYTSLNLLAAKSGMADLVDVEVLHNGRKATKLIEEIQGEGVRTIASIHVFDGVPSNEELQKRLHTLKESGADIIKLAVMAKNQEDTRRFMEVIHDFSAGADLPIIAMAMGDEGQESRMSGERFGSCLTFGTITAGSAPGQLPVGELRELLRQVHASLLGGEDA